MSPHDPHDLGPRFFGVAVGVVTDNKDPDNLGRVQLKYPWLSDKETSFWARVAAPGAGPERGVYFLPEVGDEVLVAFEHGRPEFAYVLGALWNGKDKPPVPNDKGKDQRILRSRSGLQITLDDKDEKVEIKDKDGKNLVEVDAKNGKITIQSDAELHLIAKKKLTIGTSDADLEVKCKNYKVTCTKLDVNSGALEVS